MEIRNERYRVMKLEVLPGGAVMVTGTRLSRHPKGGDAYIKANESDTYQFKDPEGRFSLKDDFEVTETVELAFPIR